jgi:hypothetical protein
MAENALGFDGAHVLGAITELFDLLADEGTEEALRGLQVLQKRLKYGLPGGAPILLYEAGFSDRPLALELAQVLPAISNRAEMRDGMREEKEVVEQVLDRYPTYFTHVFERVAG